MTDRSLKYLKKNALIILKSKHITQNDIFLIKNYASYKTREKKNMQKISKTITLINNLVEKLKYIKFPFIFVLRK